MSLVTVSEHQRVLPSSSIGQSTSGSQLSMGGRDTGWTRERERGSKKTQRDRERERQ